MARDGLIPEVQEVEEAVIQMAVFVKELIARAMEAIVLGDERLAGEVIAKDRIADAQRAEIRRRVIATIEHWAPVGTSLRKIIAYQMIADQLERIGDYAVHIARNARLAYRVMPLEIVGAVADLAQQVRSQVREGVRALAQADLLLAEATCKMDDLTDRQHWALLAAVEDHIRAHPADVSTATQLLFSIRDLERIGDRISNICEDVIYIVTGKSVKLN